MAKPVRLAFRPLPTATSRHRRRYGRATCCRHQSPCYQERSWEKNGLVAPARGSINRMCLREGKASVMADRPANRILSHVRKLMASRAPDQSADAELLERFAGRHDEAAFAALVTRHGPMVLRVCRRVLPDWQSAEDAFQATFLVLARKAGALSRR